MRAGYSVVLPILAVGVTLGSADVGSAKGARGAVLVRVEAVGDLAGAVVVQASPLSSSDDGAVAAAKEVRVVPPASFELEVAAGERWGLSVEGGPWAAPLVVDGEEAEVRLVVYPGAVVEAPLALHPGETRDALAQLPTSAVARVRPWPGRNDFPAADVPCVREERILACLLPALRLDLKVSLAGYVPLYFWNLDLSQGGTQRLEERLLVAGSSLTGFVTVPDGSASGVLVSAEPAFALPSVPAERRRALATRATTNERGFFLVAGLPPGEYTVRAERPGAIAAEVAGVRVVAGEETPLLAPLRLTEPSPLDVYVSPPTMPGGEPWRVAIQQVRGGSWEGEVSSAGSWSGTGFGPGTYEIRLTAADGSVVARREIEVDGRPPPVEIHLDIVEIEGVVRRGDEPFAAREVVFHGIPGVRTLADGRQVFENVAEAPEGVFTPDARSLSFRPDEEGAFAGFLPHPGWWQVEVRTGADAPRNVVSVEVRRRDDGRPTRVAVEVPATRVDGTVVDSDGRPAGEGRVVAIDAVTGRIVGTTAIGAAGAFELETLPLRRLLFEGRTRQGVSDAVSVELTREEPTHRVELVIGGAREARGMVVSGQGPVAGAKVQVRPVAGGLPIWLTLGTDLQGVFRVDLSAGTRALDLIVVAPGHPVRLLRQAVAPPGESAVVFSVAMPDAGGSLRVAWEAGATPHGVEIAHGGARFALADLVSAHLPSDPTVLQPGGFYFPRLAAGAYTLCTAAGSCRDVAVWPGQETEARITANGGIE